MNKGVLGKQDLEPIREEPPINDIIPESVGMVSDRV
jgi:hypothetical protein